MALQPKESTNYVKINKEYLRQLLSNAHFHTYESQVVRDSGLGEFQTAPESSTTIVVTDEFLDTVVTNLYGFLKETDQFKDATDV